LACTRAWPHSQTLPSSLSAACSIRRWRDRGSRGPCWLACRRRSSAAPFVHAANLALFALILFWQPIPIEIWRAPSPLREVLWAVFAAGWLILFFGALSFGMFDLLGTPQMRAWYRGVPPPRPLLRTSLLYRRLPHPMYVGVLLAMWATPRMTVGHMLLAAGMTVYVLIAVRYEERDFTARFGTAYTRWPVRRLPSTSVP
jgi:protein-S-isoprenylcysteine O-methyltransferase Ste14